MDSSNGICSAGVDCRRGFALDRDIRAAPLRADVPALALAAAAASCMSVPTSVHQRLTTELASSACALSSSLTAALSSALAALVCVTFSICAMACDTCSMPCDC